ncbi:MAG: DUF29 domain-containing protein [Pseudomonadota bacterium]|nr:DUF29 domain-containing protein [Pseudomonadota bacterium]
MKHATYDQDFYAWTQDQAAQLRVGKLVDLDLEHLIEELESMGRSELRALESSLGRLLQHLLKWRYQPALRCTSWKSTIKNQRREVAKNLCDNPSLKSRLPGVFEDAYETAKGWAEAETGLDEKTFSMTCPWPFDQAMNADFYPE